MSTIFQVLNAASQSLKNSRVANPSLDAQILLAHVLQKNREFIIGYPETEVSPKEISMYDFLIKRRNNREPVAKIIGKKEFWSRDFEVSSATLDPRPDSETLIEAVMEVFRDKERLLNIVDFGTGSGCLLLTILSEYPHSLGIGVDINKDTLDVAARNAEKLGLAKRSEFILNDWAEGMEGKFDLIISNPPYIKNSDIKELEPEVSAHEPYIALAGGEDGLDCYRLLASQINNFLKQDGYLILEFGIGQENIVREIFENAAMKFVSFKSDLAGITRCIVLSR